MPNQYDGIAITKQLLFGTADVPADFNERVRPVDPPNPVFNVDSDTFLATGAGRYGWLSRANLVEKFFANSSDLSEGIYTRAELVDAMDALDNLKADGEPKISANLEGDLIIPINNYQMDSHSSDWVERAYIFGAGEAKLQSATFHIAADGTATISDILIQPEDDNFDFTSGTGVAQGVNTGLLKPALDPYGLGAPAVDIKFTQASALTFGGDSVYDFSMFQATNKAVEDRKGRRKPIKAWRRSRKFTKALKGKEGSKGEGRAGRVIAHKIQLPVDSRTDTYLTTA